MNLHRKNLDELADAATEQITESAMDVLELGLLDEDGLAFGDVEHRSDAEFAEWYIDLFERGVLAQLQAIAPHFAERWRKRFDRVAAQMMAEV